MKHRADGEIKICPDCGCLAKFSSKTRVPGSDAAFVAPGGGSVMPEPLPPTPAWSCFCGYFEPVPASDLSSRKPALQPRNAARGLTGAD